ncbi:hypothetical protein [Ovoidimarina sediminis]|uniref:hypothetical protein n=1 Tax=Ovoidimarina sediminis TaxID=3079856 RepID=UPI0029076051|nr:hypothetical protein [Rhodophyticola sp. MJ-SS7]MDU8946390.1 hypothetical protein [Rhodophyticola sp. MJ-SS7]
MIEINETPTGCVVMKENEPVHKSPIPKPAAQWLAGDLENEPEMVDLSEFDLGTLYTTALVAMSWLIPNASIQANALSIAFHTLSNGQAMQRAMN